jgi:hypothetical protein
MGLKTLDPRIKEKIRTETVPIWKPKAILKKPESRRIDKK